MAVDRNFPPPRTSLDRPGRLPDPGGELSMELSPRADLGRPPGREDDAGRRPGLGVLGIGAEADSEGLQAEGAHQGPHGCGQDGRFDRSEADRTLAADQFDQTGPGALIADLTTGIDQDPGQAATKATRAPAALALAGHLGRQPGGSSVARVSDSGNQTVVGLLGDSCAADMSTLHRGARAIQVYLHELGTITSFLFVHIQRVSCHSMVLVVEAATVRSRPAGAPAHQRPARLPLRR